MFCPKCGDTMVERNGVLTCVRGDMPLSPKLNQDLHDCFVANTRQPIEKQHYNYRIGGTWYCPGCGVLTTEDETGAIRCPRCKRNLREFMHHLIELHPHRRINRSE